MMFPTKIYLIGMMGAGKTTVGEVLSEHLGYDFIDLDKQIESTENNTIQQIFSLQGEDYFRDRETLALESTALKENIIISTGGGIIKRKENLKFLNQHTCVYLKGSIDTLEGRLRADKTRPLLQGQNLYKTIENLLAEREFWYQEISNIIINIDDKKVEEVVQEVEEKLRGKA